MIGKQIAGVRYIGEEPCPVVMQGYGDIKKGCIITSAADDVLAYLAARADFEIIEADGDPAVSAEAKEKE